MRTQRPARPGARGTERRSERERSGRGGELLYGLNATRESLLAGRRRHRRLLLAAGAERDERRDALVALARRNRVPVEEVSRADLDARCRGHHQGIVLEASAYPYAEPPDVADLAAARGSVLALDSVVDPQNVGALLRSADAAGFHHVVIPEDRSAGITPAVVHASAGAAEHLAVWREVNLARWLAKAKAAGIWVAGLAVDPRAESLFDVDLRPPLALVVGSEGAGLRRLVRDACDLLVQIPMTGHVESLNASVAGALAMYEVRRWLDDDRDLGGPQRG